MIKREEKGFGCRHTGRAYQWLPGEDEMNDATATSAVEGFSAELNRMPLVVRKSMTYDQGREMAKHAEITQNSGVVIYFADLIALGSGARTKMSTV